MATINEATKELMVKINDAILNPIIYLFFAIALLLFLWGVVEFIMNSENADKKAEGAQHILWGVIGLAIMLSVLGIIQVIKGTIGA